VAVAGEHLVGGAVRGAGAGVAAVSPVSLLTVSAQAVGQAGGVLRPAVAAVSTVQGAGEGGASVPGFVPRVFRVEGFGSALDEILPSCLLCSDVAGQGAADAELGGYPMYLGEGVRMDFRETDSFPAITFREVL